MCLPSVGGVLVGFMERVSEKTGRGATSASRAASSFHSVTASLIFMAASGLADLSRTMLRVRAMLLHNEYCESSSEPVTIAILLRHAVAPEATGTRLSSGCGTNQRWTRPKRLAIGHSWRQVHWCRRPVSAGERPLSVHHRGRRRARKIDGHRLEEPREENPRRAWLQRAVGCRRHRAAVTKGCRT